MSAVRKRENEHLSEVAGQLAKHADDKHQSTLMVGSSTKVSGLVRGSCTHATNAAPCG